MRKMIFFLCLIFITGSGLGPLYGQEPIQLRMVTFLSEDDPNVIPWLAFVDEVNAKVKGEMEIVYAGGPEKIPATEQFEALRKGEVDMILGCESYYGSNITGAPYTHLSRLNPLQERKCGYYNFRQRLLVKHNIQYLGRGEFGGWFHIFTNRGVTRPNGLKGQRIRVSATYEPFVRALGAIPVSLEGASIYNALKESTIDGYGWAVIGNVKMRWPEVCKYILEPRLYQMNIEGLINFSAWEKLPERFQNLIMACMVENEEKYMAITAKIAEKEYREMQKRGMRIIKFSPIDSQYYVDLSYKAGWDEVTKENPDVGPELKKLLSP